MKDELEVKLGQVFGKILQSVAMEDEQLVVERRGICKVIKQYRVAFLERDGRKTKMVLVDGLLETNEKLDDVCKKLSEQMFVRCHNSFAVNLFQVQEYHRDAFIMKNGEAIPISRRYMQKVRIKFLEWAQLYQ